MKRDYSVRAACAAISVTCIALLDVAGAQERKDAPRATVELVVRSPDGRPLANAEVDVQSGKKERPSARAKTDAQGRISFSWPEGLHRVEVMAKGIGYGTTGCFELLEGDTARPALAPLVPFGAIEGVVPKDSLEPGMYVEISEMPDRAARRADCDKAGRFVFENLTAGEYCLTLQPKSRGATRLTNVVIQAGQRARNVVFHKEEDEPPSKEPRRASGSGNENAKTIVWAAGTVRDEAGQPVEDVDVFAVVRYDYRHRRMIEAINSAKTDKEGRWEVAGSDSLPSLNGTLIAHKAGHPYTYLPLHDAMPKDDQGKSVKADLRAYDFVLPRHGGNLEVIVSREGQPWQNGAVRLAIYRGPHAGRPDYVQSGRSENREILTNLLSPSATTDAHGVARFSDLVPGEYELAASAGGPETIKENRLKPITSTNYSASAGGPETIKEVRSSLYVLDVSDYVKVPSLAVPAGKTRHFEVAVLPQGRSLPIKVMRPDGQLYPDAETSFRGEASVEGGRSFDMRSGKGKQRVFTFFQPGLRRVQFNAGNPRTHRDSRDELPHEEAAAMIGVSAVLPENPAPILTTTHRRLGSLVVQLQDPAGRPLRGYAFVDRDPFADVPTFAGTTDERGEVRFEGIQPDKHYVEALPAGQTFPDLGEDEDPFPAEKDLLGRMIVEKQDVTTPADTETRITMRAKPAGYVRTTLRPPAGLTPADYSVLNGCNSWIETFGCHVRYNTKTCEYLLGPWAEGKHTVYVVREGSGPAFDLAVSHDLAVSQDVTVQGDRVVHLDITPPPKAGKGQPGHQPQKVFIDMGGVHVLAAEPPRSPGRVFLSDGKTAAYAAELAYFVPDNISPVGKETTDALGRFSFGESRYSGNAPREVPPGSPTVPVLVAWLPGSCGATITPIKDEANAKDLKIVLPPPLAVSGKVTVGGKDVRGRRSLFRVVAEYEGQGSLTRVLSRSVTPEMDGRFELPALTPGTYQVQAAMDNIWLSTSVRLKVSAVGKMEPLTLDVGQPGPAATLRIVNQAGTPLPDVKATVARPEGPLADLLWPREFTSDGAGVLHIPPLEAGTHRLQVRGAAKERLLTVPPIADVNAIEVEPPVIVQ